MLPIIKTKNTMIMKNLEEIKAMPIVYDNVHESIYKSYAILELVKEMLLRGDSGETILMTINHLQL